jgi:signal transduction histidine kinase
VNGFRWLSRTGAQHRRGAWKIKTPITKSPSKQTGAANTAIGDSDRERLFATFIVVGLFFIVTFEIYGYIDNHPIYALLDGITAVVIFLTYFTLQHVLKLHIIAVWATVLENTICLGVLFYIGGMNGADYLWSYSVALFAVFLIGKRSGLILSALYIVFLLIISVFHASLPYAYAYPYRMLLRFFAVLVLTFVLTWFFEASRNRAEKKLLEQNISLNKALADLESATQAQQVLAKQLERSNHELQQFAYIASHDLKEPLRKVVAFGDRLKTKFADTIGETGKDYLERMQNATVRMQDLIDGLLSYSRVTSQGEPFKRVDLNTIAREVLGDLETSIGDKKATVTLSGLPIIEADPMQMRQLLQNLVGNALKYAKHDVPPVVAIDAHVDNGSCTIKVKDNGIGFEQQYAEQIFGVFRRLHGRGSEYDGTGIGLSVCQKIVLRHGGAISANGVSGQGSEFTVTLPLTQERSVASS